MNKIIGIGILLLVLLAFTGLASATSTSTFNSKTNEYTTHPYKGKIAYTSTSTSTYKSNGYSSYIKETVIGKVVSFTSQKIRVRCVDTTIDTTWSTYSGKDVSKSVRVYYLTLYR